MERNVRKEILRENISTRGDDFNREKNRNNDENEK